jgi:BirA family biotin operon repressor/biotin-[acetyl-CoA-carboxylase] ligase
LSIALAFRKEIIDKVPLVPLAAGIAACDAIVEVCGVSPKLKWPNDVLVDGRKLGGILTELVSQKTEQAVLIVGIGVNTGTSSFPSSLRDVAVSIPLLKGKAADPSDVAARFVSTLCVWKDRIEIGETAALVAAWRARAEPFGRRVRVGALEGMTRDLTPEGRLQIVQDNGDITEVVGGIVESIA